MIQSFADRDTEQLFRDERNRRFQNVARVALRKLIQMNRADKPQNRSSSVRKQKTNDQP
jgi:proteic killer suppression protein